MRKVPLWAAGLGVLVLLLALEAAARLFAPSYARLRRADKLAHCPDASGFSMYCPNASVDFSTDHFQFHLTTDNAAERITRPRSSAASMHQADSEIWMLGDSIVTGYGIDDEASAPYLIAGSVRGRVRNLAVDGLGLRGTMHQFRENLRAKKPARVYYLFDYSEFADEARESNFTSSGFRRFLLRADAVLSRESMLYCLLRAPPARGMTAGPAPVIARDHPAFESFRSLSALARSSGVELVVILYAGGGLDGRPGRDQTYQDLVASAASVEKITVLDLRSNFLARSMQETLYIPGDGHPSEAGARIIAEAVVNDLRARPPSGQEALWK